MFHEVGGCSQLYLAGVGKAAKEALLHFWAKLNTVSWCVDLQAGKVSKHKGIPIIVKSLFDTGRFELSLKAKCVGTSPG